MDYDAIEYKDDYAGFKPDRIATDWRYLRSTQVQVLLSRPLVKRLDLPSALEIIEKGKSPNNNKI